MPADEQPSAAEGKRLDEVAMGHRAEDDCANLMPPPAVPYAQGRCAKCGKPVFRLPTDRGITTEAGDALVIPPGSLRISLDPRSSNGTLTRPGVTWFVNSYIQDPSPKNADELRESLAKYRELADEILQGSELFSDLEDNPAGHLAAMERVKDQPERVELWALAVMHLTVAVEQSLDAGDIANSAFLMSRLEISRAILIYMRLLEPLVWRGYSMPGFDALQAIGALWENNRTTSSEEFWQTALTGHLDLLSQILHVPAVLYKGKAYVGGKRVENRGGSVTDFLLQNPVTGMVAVVEIKTPMTTLLSRTEYRGGVYAPSSELSGAVTQVLSQREKITQNLYSLAYQNPDFRSVDPLCVVLVGDASRQLTTPEQVESFELYRRNLRNVQVLTFDELFTKVKLLIDAISSVHA